MRAFLTALLTLLLAGQALAGNSTQFKKWTLEKATEGDETYVRVWADSETQNPRGAFFVYRDPGACQTPGLMAIVMMPKKGSNADWTEGAMRVDEKTIHAFKYSYRFPKDNGMAVVYMKDVSELSVLGDEMRQGSNLRLKIQVSGRDVYLRIPLAGFVDASAKQTADCEALPASGKKSSKEAQGGKKRKKDGGFGTGFFVSADGYVVTNFHVVDAGEKIVCEYQNEKYDAKIIKVDHINDLALLKLDMKPKAFLDFRKGKPVRTGEEVVAIGYPYYGMVSTHPNITNGTVSSAVGLGDDTRWLQITAPVQPGNSGGPLLDSSGNLVGVVSARLNALAVAKETGDIPQNINFAIRIPLVKSFLEVNEVGYSEAESVQDLKVVEIGEKCLPAVVLVVAMPKDKQ